MTQPAVADDPFHDLDAEARLLGAALAAAEPHRTSAILALVEPHEFADPVTGRLWGKARDIHRSGRLLYPVGLAEAMGRDGDFAPWGGVALLHDLLDLGHPYAAETLAASVRDRALRRALAAQARARTAALHDLSIPAFDQLTSAQRGLSALVEASAPDQHGLVDAAAAATAAVDAMEAEAAADAPRGLTTGLVCIDQRLGGLRPGWLVVLAGRPSMGKTALARSAAMAAARRHPDRLCVFFTLEMDARELSDRSLAEQSHLDGWGIAYKDMRPDVLGTDDRARLRRLAAGLPANFIIDDAPALSLDHVRRRLHGLKRRGRLGLAVIDYLQIMTRPPAHGRNEASVIGEITQGLKQLARELDVCIVLLSQLNRAVEGRDDKRPQLADLRDSGAIEQDANAVLLLYRELYYLERAEPTDVRELEAWDVACELVRRRLEVHAAKVRGGKVGRDIQDYAAEFDHVADPAPETTAQAYREAKYG